MNIIDEPIYHVVTSATPTSELVDVLFVASPRRLVLQGLGGLLDMRPDTRMAPSHAGRPYLVGVYTDEAEALIAAMAELERSGAVTVGGEVAQ